ncbi:unnamed protein product [Staurois parvus]|uniref:Aminotransferase class V domain-containing protein n=1 Tax=Staurois parvus TaxID=386267 RepID=A0ABN9AYT7_9NEOB|nr:unnamed protein product [Staurois parvus]
MLCKTAIRRLLAAGGCGRVPAARASREARTADWRDRMSKEDSELRPLYMDVQATTPMDPRVLDRMLPYLVNYYGNPHSRTHAYGWESEKAMEKGREFISQCSKWQT